LKNVILALNGLLILIMGGILGMIVRQRSMYQSMGIDLSMHSNPNAFSPSFIQRLLIASPWGCILAITIIFGALFIICKGHKLNNPKIYIQLLFILIVVVSTYMIALFLPIL